MVVACLVQTYTSIKNTVPVVKVMIRKLALKLNLEGSTSEKVNDSTIRIFFPDMGEAVLARKTWKMGPAYQENPELEALESIVIANPEEGAPETVIAKT